MRAALKRRIYFRFVSVEETPCHSYSDRCLHGVVVKSSLGGGGGGDGHQGRVFSVCGVVATEVTLARRENILLLRLAGPIFLVEYTLYFHH